MGRQEVFKREHAVQRGCNKAFLAPFFTVLHALGACILHLWRALYPRFKVLGTSAGMFIGVTPAKGPLH